MNLGMPLGAHTHTGWALTRAGLTHLKSDQHSLTHPLTPPPSERNMLRGSGGVGVGWGGGGHQPRDAPKKRRRSLNGGGGGETEEKG